MITNNIFTGTENRKIVEKKDKFSVMEYIKDLSVSPQTAQNTYLVLK